MAIGSPMCDSGLPQSVQWCSRIQLQGNYYHNFTRRFFLLFGSFNLLSILTTYRPTSCFFPFTYIYAIEKNNNSTLSCLFRIADFCLVAQGKDQPVFGGSFRHILLCMNHWRRIKFWADKAFYLKDSKEKET